MTVAIPEAVSAVEGAGGAVASRGGGKVVQGRVEGSTYDLRNARTRSSPRPGPRPSAARSGPAAPTVAEPRDRSGVVDLGGRGGGRSYQGAILAEFLVAVLVVAFLPLASGPGDGKAGPSPYRVNDMIQLVAIGAVYFILALFSSGERSGRIVAWFGGLLTLGILIAKVGSGQLSAAVSSVSGVSKADLDNT